MAADRGESRDLKIESYWDDNKVLDNKLRAKAQGLMSVTVIKQGFGCFNEVYSNLFQAVKTSACKDPTFRRFNHNTPEYKTAATSAPSPLKRKSTFASGNLKLQAYEDFRDTRLEFYMLHTEKSGFAFGVSSVIKDDYQDILRRLFEGVISNESVDFAKLKEPAKDFMRD
ncbi:hypothetical protein K469DRAFT_696595 [Zopfia rhizophila CBS 207.26]|uniref:Uncharacterized protein n=1 Tax=Zopfia rhizophila CBS 207.26 TaxID=1314779 RepID=A0A6A6DEK3_9PEZI|nr:hypothetical protein K469DRAFT_696595 [Zopfia rhizophila CBS 207.26]